MKKCYTRCLFAGRHEIPGNPEPIFGELPKGPLDKEVLYQAARAGIPEDCNFLRVYVTGFTPAMLAVVEVCFQDGITLEALSFDKETGEYVSQYPLVYDTCPFCHSPMSRYDYTCPSCGS